MQKISNVKISMKGLDRFVNCKQQLYNKKNIVIKANVNINILINMLMYVNL